eukprot:CAMPEP_0118974312 /NCGR_PEP_ID=MMETSP1173-20130426/11181_1 /TAXON_ID=1034831 /ORGANISM="Rhizochromulina marina cf, Strain CCMP1243" /LENGTH=617 /DNA_ID=CAMNT_0006924029 /DNA_START=84 /DNA_END=1937 /DNA_ORIENTATION=+
MAAAASTSTTFGFIGLGIMGQGMVNNLLKEGRAMVVWNRSAGKCQELLEAYPALVTVASTPTEVVAKADITFSMLSTLEASEAVFGEVVAGVTEGKAIIDCATLTPERMQEQEAQIKAKGGRFLEAPVSGSKGPAATGQLIFLCGGEDALFSLVRPELDIMGKASFNFGPVGAGSRMKLVVNMIMGNMLTSLAEGMALAEASSLSQSQLLEVLDLGVMSNMMFRLKGPNMMNRAYGPQFPLKHAQKDMRFALALGDAVGQALPVSAAANAAFLHAREGHGDDDFGAVYEAVRPPPSSTAQAAVLFDFDGTLGDTEAPAMDVAFWYLAPFLVGATAANVASLRGDFVRENAGKAIEFMLEACNAERAKAGLPSVAEVVDAGSLDADLVAVVDSARSAYGLPPLVGVLPKPYDAEAHLSTCKVETVSALGTCATSCPGVIPALCALRSRGVRYAIATTSPKPRVPTCVDKAGLRAFFPDSKIHSGESDFDPPRFKPMPDVYLRAAQGEDREPGACVAVEDSASGVGSAANAGIGLIVGYVGASHIPAEKKADHARMLQLGTRSENKRGADIVISQFEDLLPLVDHFNHLVESPGGGGPGASKIQFPAEVLGKLSGVYWC